MRKKWDVYEFHDIICHHYIYIIFYLKIVDKFENKKINLKIAC